MTEFLSVDNIAFTILGYPLSYVELFGTVLYLWSVWLIAHRRVLTWPVGIVSVLLYMALFYQIRLYADAMEQVYYLIVSVYGWLHWGRSPTTNGQRVIVRFSLPREIVRWIIAAAILSIFTGLLISRLHQFLPGVFPEPASFPFLDALTTVMSFVAMWLMAKKRIESWIYWIIVDVIAIGLYFVKDVWFVSLLYVILLIMAINGLMTWSKSASDSASAKSTPLAKHS